MIVPETKQAGMSVAHPNLFLIPCIKIILNRVNDWAG